MNILLVSIVLCAYGFCVPNICLWYVQVIWVWVWCTLCFRTLNPYNIQEHPHQNWPLNQWFLAETIIIHLPADCEWKVLYGFHRNCSTIRCWLSAHGKFDRGILAAGNTLLYFTRIMAAWLSGPYSVD